MSKESKFLAFVLRHDPSSIGLELGPGGWVPVDALLKGMRRAGHPLSRDALETLVATNEKKRFTLSEDGLRIRAAQGHSIPVDLDLCPVTPPDTLYHGTARSNLDAIFAEGLLPGRRRHVHLSNDHDTAIKVGQRHGKPVVLTVHSGRMCADGQTFWRADNGVWLTERVAPHYLSFS